MSKSKGIKLLIVMWVIAGVLWASVITLFIIHFWYDAGVMSWLFIPLCLVASIFPGILTSVKNTIRSRKKAALEKSETGQCVDETQNLTQPTDDEQEQQN